MEPAISEGNSHSNLKQNRIPVGYVVIDGPNEEKYLVPNFMASATAQAIEADRQKNELQVDDAGKGVSRFSFSYHRFQSMMPLKPLGHTKIPCIAIAGGEVQVLMDPVSTGVELLNACTYLLLLSILAEEKR